MKKVLVVAITVSAFLGVFLNVLQYSIDEGSLFMGLAVFRYFTVLSNLAVFIYFLLLFIKPKIDNGRYHNYFGAILIYIFITMTVFIIFLEPIYSPKGLHLVSSIFSHYLSPLLVIAFFVIERDDYHFRLSNIKQWIIFPLAYIVFVIIYGSITGDFLYPFFQVSVIGILGLILAIVSLVLLFVLLCFLVVKIVSKE